MFGAACIMYIMKNTNNPDFCSILTSSDDKDEILEKFKENIKAFNKYFDTDDFKGNENAIYNKIFLKFKDKNDNNTIEINEFIEELNT